MIKGFEGYYPPDFDKLWAEAVFVFDTNVLLDLFRYSQNTRKELLEILEKLDDRIWIPHQFFYEYHRNKMTIHESLADAYRESEKQLKQCSDITIKELHSLREKLRNLKNRTGVEIDPRVEVVGRVFAEIQDEISNSEEQHLRSLDEDPLEEKIVELFAENYGKPFEDSRLASIRKLAKERLQRGIPPGSTKDNKKNKSDPDGDLIGWLQIMDHAEEEKLPTILVTNDSDWFLGTSSNTIGPHPELLQEMFDEAGVGCYIYRTTEFIKFAKDYLDAQVSDKTIEEAENRERYIAEQERLVLVTMLEHDRRAMEAMHEEEHIAREAWLEEDRRAAEAWLEEDRRAAEAWLEEDRRAAEAWIEEDRRAAEAWIEEDRRAAEAWIEEDRRAAEAWLEEECVSNAGDAGS